MCPGWAASSGVHLWDPWMLLWGGGGKGQGAFAEPLTVVWGLLIAHLPPLRKRTRESICGKGESRANRDIDIHLFYRKWQKMRKAITHFLETGSVGVSRYQSKPQDKAKRSEGLGCDYKPYFSGQIFNHQVNGVLQDTGVSAHLGWGAQNLFPGAAVPAATFSWREVSIQECSFRKNN